MALKGCVRDAWHIERICIAIAILLLLYFRDLVSSIFGRTKPPCYRCFNFRWNFKALLVAYVQVPDPNSYCLVGNQSYSYLPLMGNLRLKYKVVMLRKERTLTFLIYFFSLGMHLGGTAMGKD